MAFIQVTAPIRQREGGTLSADNAKPNRFTLLDLLRRAAPAFGIKPTVLATLEAMLSCLPDSRSHDTVFASNATLAFRRNGITDRTLRRHIAILEDVGFVARKDSPNRKRFTRHDPTTGAILRFGFDLSPLFARAAEIADVAARSQRASERSRFLRMQLRVAINRSLIEDPLNDVALHAAKALRRKLSDHELQALTSGLPEVRPDFEENNEATSAIATKTTATDSQNVRHHHKSKKETLDSDKCNEPENVAQQRRAKTNQTDVTVATLLHACPAAAEFALKQIITVGDVIEHAHTIAPMMGIDRHAISSAVERHGAIGAAITIWGVLQLQPRVHKLGAYFRSITSGQRSAEFDPWAFIAGLARQRTWSAAA